MKVLIAEDEVQMNRVLTTALTHEGYDVDSVYDGQAAIDKANENAYDVMVMDIMMPIKSGIEAVQEIRQSGNQAHIIMLTAMSEIDDRVTGLDAGADDYLTKPFSLKELLARLRSMSRRVDTAFTSNILKLGSVTLNVGEQELASQNTIRLAGKEAKMLEFFMLNPGKNYQPIKFLITYGQQIRMILTLIMVMSLYMFLTFVRNFKLLGQIS